MLYTVKRVEEVVYLGDVIKENKLQGTGIIRKGLIDDSSVQQEAVNTASLITINFKFSA